MVFWHNGLEVAWECWLCLYVLVVNINSGLYSCFIGEIATCWHHAGIGLRMCYSSRCFGRTPEQPEGDPLCLKLFAGITTRDSVVTLMALYYCILEWQVLGEHWNIRRKTWKLIPVPLAQTPVWRGHRTQTSAVKSWRLTAWVTTTFRFNVMFHS